jgi:hypothetical protein
MSNYEKEIITQLESMPFNKARHEILTGTFCPIGSPNHAFCLSWLDEKEALLRDRREGEALRIARRGNNLAITALVLSLIAIGVAIFK